MIISRRIGSDPVFGLAESKASPQKRSAKRLLVHSDLSSNPVTDTTTATTAPYDSSDLWIHDIIE